MCQVNSVGKGREERTGEKRTQREKVGVQPGSCKRKVI